MRYRNRSFQLFYQSLLSLAVTKSSELYYNGQPRRGAGHRCAFWDGYSGVNPSPHAIPGTLGAVAFQAGREWKRRESRGGSAYIA